MSTGQQPITHPAAGFVDSGCLVGHAVVAQQDVAMAVTAGEEDEVVATARPRRGHRQ